MDAACDGLSAATADRDGDIACPSAPASASLSASPDSRQSQLSIDDLVADGGGSGGTTPQPLNQSTISFGPNDTKCVEAKLQLNLQQQHEHYARQRSLFEALGRDSLLGGSPTRKQDEEHERHEKTRSKRDESDDDSSMMERKQKFQLRLTAAAKLRPDADLDDDNDNDNDDDDDGVAIDRLQRKAKSIASYHSRIAHSAPRLHSTRSATHATKASGIPRPRTGSIPRLDESAAHYASSNDALRKQLELLRRLQLENNRFRHENRSLRDQNDVLDEQTTLHTRESKRLQEEVQELSLRVQHDQLELATAAQTIRKLKQLQKQLEAVQSERDQLQTALQEASDQDAQLRLRTQNEIESVVQENKHLKRSLKQSRQHETRLQDQIEELKHTITVGEQAVGELKQQLVVMQHETSAMATQLSDKTTHVAAIEASATQCVERMEAGMEALQKAHTGEREKRKKLEKLRDTLQSEMQTLENANTTLQERVHELETYTSQLQQRLQDHKLEKKQEKKFQEEKGAEFQERHKSDAKTITMLRDECSTYEQQLDVARTSIVEIRKEVATESNALRKEVEALRNYIEDAQRATISTDSRGGGASNERSVSDSRDPPLASRTRREELWVQLPELQFLQGAVGGLRNEAMNFVGDFQRARHQLRQQTAKLSAAHDRVVELEHLRSEDAILRQELADQRLLAEQAREITVREKMEVLAWSQQACEKSERLEAALNKCGASVQGVIKKSRCIVAAVASADPKQDDGVEDGDASKATPLLSSKPDEDVVTHVTRLVQVMERETHDLIIRVETLADNHKATMHESDDRQQRIVRLQKDVEAQRQDHAAVVAEIESLHTRAIAEKQQHFTSSLQAVESERDTLQKHLDDERETVAGMHTLSETLETKLHDLEADIPVLATITQLFALVVPPLVLQVNDLLLQKRVLMKENAEYAMAHAQVECIGHVLRELVPTSVGADSSSEPFAEQQRRQRRRKFRRVVIAVFALNRFQRGGFVGNAAGTGESVYGVCTSLKPMKKKKTKAPTSASLSSSFGAGGSASCLPPQTMIKVLPATPVLSRLNLRALLDRLRAMDLQSKLRDAVESASDGNSTTSSLSSSSSSSFGSLLMEMLAVMDPSHKEVLVENTAGAFHCRALLERRKAARWQDASPSGVSDHEDARLSTVDLIRKRILALGKRLEDLHYQRNALQKENYDFQFRLDQQATQLHDMDALVQKNDAMQQEIEQLHELQRAEATATQTELTDRDRMLRDREQRIATQQDQIVRLESELATFETRISELELEKTDLHHALLIAQSASVEEEEKLHKSRIGLDKQAEEVRALKQATKRAHELHQRVAWQLEQELVEKASLQATTDRLRKQQETLEREVARAKVHALDGSTDADADDQDGDDRNHHHQSPPKKAKAREKPLATSSSSTSSYERQLQDLTDRIATMRSAASMPTNHDDEDEPTESLQLDPTRRKTGDHFRSEWQRLDISGVFDEDDHKQRPRGDHNAEVSHESSPTRRRGDEIDKVNSAVHDYMDRIDDKLQQMYGIPKSSSRQRPLSTASVIHGTVTKAVVSKSSEVRWGDTAEFE